MLYNVQVMRKKSTGTTFIQDDQFQVVALENGLLPKNWPDQAKYFNTFRLLERATIVCNDRARWNENSYAVVDRFTGEIVHTCEVELCK